MKKRYLSRVFLLLLCAAVLVPLLPKAALASKPVEKIINVPVNKGSLSSGFLYEDSMVLADASQMSTDILKASVELANAAYSAGLVDDCFSAMGFDLVARRNYAMRVKTK